jgi:hypothetical protein
MAAPDYSAASALSEQAATLLAKAHTARAAEKFAAALAAATAGGAPADCLVLAFLRVQHANASLSHADTPGLARAQRAAALRAALSPQLLPAAIDTLTARAAAGTLLPGACRPAELAFYRGYKRRLNAVAGSPAPRDGAQAHLEASVALLGVETYASAAYVSLNTLAMETRDALEETTGDILCGSLEQELEQAHRCWRFVGSALELMAARPRPPGGVWTCGETSLMSQIKQTVESGALPPAHPAHGLVMPAWDKLTRLRQLGGAGGFLAHAVDATREHQKTNRAKVVALATTASALRVCASAECGAWEAHPKQFKLCAACQSVVYCCKAHQTEDWASHKSACKAARKVAAAQGGVGASGGAGPSGSA